MVNATYPTFGRRQSQTGHDPWNTGRDQPNLLPRIATEHENLRITTGTGDDGYLQAQDVPSVAQIVNRETQSRLLISRLRELIIELRNLRRRAEALNASSTSAETGTNINFRYSLHALDNSVEQLQSAIRDLESRVVSASRRAVTGSLDRSFIDPFSPSPIRSLLTRARQWGNESHHGTIEIQSPVTNASLDQRLDRFSQNLADLNLRLDNVARNFQEMQQALPADFSPYVANNHAQAQSEFAESDQARNLYSLSTYDQTDNATAIFIASIETRRARGQEVSPEELELQLRLQHLRSSNLTDGDWRANNHRRGLLDISRRAVFRDAHHFTNTASRAIPEDALMSFEASAPRSRSWGRSAEGDDYQDPSVNLGINSGDTLPEKSNEVCSPSLPKSNEIVAKTDAMTIRRAAFQSSHVPLMKEPERLFWQGIEYRNCMGLWLSINGKVAPNDAFRSEHFCVMSDK